MHVPCVLPGQLTDPLWLGLTALWTVATVWGYVYWWPRGTLTYGRKLYLAPQVLFGLAWGLTSGQLTLVLWALVEDFGFARWSHRAAGVLPALGLRADLPVGLVGHPRVAAPQSPGHECEEGALCPHAIPSDCPHPLHPVRQRSGVRGLSRHRARLLGSGHALSAVLGEGWASRQSRHGPLACRRVSASDWDFPVVANPTGDFPVATKPLLPLRT